MATGQVRKPVLQQHQAINWVNSSSRQIFPWFFKTATGAAEVYIPGKLVLDNSGTYVAAGLAGLGLLQGMAFLFKPWIEKGLLVEVLPGNPCPPRKLSLIYPHRHLSRKVRVFSDWLQNLLSQQQ